MKRFLAMILTLAMVMSMLPVGALAAEYTDGSAAAEATGVTATKTVSGPDENGQYTITLSVTGTSKDVTETQQLPADIVLVVDTSTSMDDTVSRTTCGGTLEAKTGTTMIGTGYTYYECTSCGATYVYNVPSACTEVTSRTNRLDVAKVAAKQFVSGLLENEGVQIGLYDFSGSNRTNVALTDNETTLNDAIDDMSMPSSGDGTDYDLGLTGAQNILASSTKEQKFVVFISDGEPNNGDYGTEVAAELQEDGVTIITVGVDVDNNAATALRNISSTNEDGDALYYAASSSGDSSTALAAILAQIQKLIEDTIHAGTDAVMTDIINTDDFNLVEGSASSGLSVGENGTMTWDIGNITKDTQTVSFKVTANEGSYGTLHTNKDVSLTFNSTALEEEVTYSKDAIGDPTVYIAPPAITVTADSNEKTYDGTALTDNGFTVDGAPEGYTVTAVVEGSQTDAGSTTNTVTSVIVTNPAGEDVTELFAEYITEVDGTLTVTKRSVVLTSESATQEYNGKALTRPNVALSGDGWAEGEGATVKATGSQTTPGSCTNTIVCELNEGTNKDNYQITKSEGTLNVTNRSVKYEIDVVANSGSKTYDGQEMTVSGFKTLEFTFDGVPFTVEGLSATVSGTNAGTYTNEITGTAVVKDADGNDVTAQFIVKTVDGTLTINKRNVTLRSATDSKPYDGTPLTNKEVTVSGDGFAEGEGATYDVTGSQLTVGNSANEFTYELNEGTKADNYTITVTPGQLTVTDRDAKYEINVVANSKTEKYDGTEKSVSGFETLTFTVDGQTYTVSGLEASAAATDAGSYTASVTGTAVVTDAYDNDVTSQFAVRTTAGTLTITKREVTLASATDEKEYDGNALTNDDITVEGDGFATGEGAAYNVTGSQTLVGSSENTFSYELNEGTKADNYTVTTKNGTLTVVNRNAKYAIEVVANSGSKKYDGEALTVEGFETLTFEVEGNTYTVSGLTAATTQTDAGEYPVNVTGTPVVKDAAGNVVTEQFAVSTKNGELVITKRAVTLTSATAMQQYNGKVLTNDTVTVSGDGFVEGEGATYDVTGSRLLVGKSDNTFTYTLNEGTKAENYDIVVVFGTLEVIDREAPYVITVEANSGEFLYDGTEKNVSGFKTLTFVVEENEYTVEGLTAEAAETNAGEYTVEITGTPVVKDAQGNAVTDQFDVELIDGTLIINRATVTVTVDENQRKVIGNEDPELTATITGLAEGDEESLISYTLTREAGENVGTYDITASGEDVQGNYNVIYVNGTFRITAGELTLNNKDHMRYMQGYPDGTFMPEKNMTRAEVAVMFCRLLNNSMSIDSDAQSPFSDVKEGDWYYEEVCFMAENGILKGYPDGTFGPWEPITRAEFATICTRFDVARQTEATVLANEFPDVTKRDWFYDYVMTAAGNGWVGGFPDGNFKPNDFITRSQVVTVVNRVLERIADKDYINNAVINGAEDFRTYIDVAGNWAYYDIYEASIAHDYHKDETEETVVETWERHWMELYTVAFHISGTTPDVASVFDETYKVGQKVDLPTAEDVAEMHNTVFLGWALTENATTPVDEYIVDADDSFVSENGVDHQIIHLYAVWG